MGTITKALELLNLFSVERPEIGLGDAQRLSGRDKATVHRHLTELLENGFLEQNQTSRAYRLGPAILRLAAVRERSFPLRSALQPVVDELAWEVGELVHVSALQGRALSPVCHRDPDIHGTRVHFDEAELLPLNATSSGLAALAFGPPELMAQAAAAPLTRHAAGSLTDPAALAAAAAAARARGISALDRGFDDEVASMAAPVFGGDGRLMGAVSIATPRHRMTDARRPEFERALRRGVRRISRALGGAIPAELNQLWDET